MFLHESLMHLGFNMFALGSFMPSLLRVWSAKRVWALYFASGLAGAAAYFAVYGQQRFYAGRVGRGVWRAGGVFRRCIPKPRCR